MATSTVPSPSPAAMIAWTAARAARQSPRASAPIPAWPSALVSGCVVMSLGRLVGRSLRRGVTWARPPRNGKSSGVHAAQHLQHGLAVALELALADPADGGQGREAGGFLHRDLGQGAVVEDHIGR